MQIGTVNPARPPVSAADTAIASLMLVSAIETITVFSSLDATKPGNTAEIKLAVSISLALNAMASVLAGSWYPLAGAAFISAVLVAFYQRQHAKRQQQQPGY